MRKAVGRVRHAINAALRHRVARSVSFLCQTPPPRWPNGCDEVAFKVMQCCWLELFLNLGLPRLIQSGHAEIQARCGVSVRRHFQRVRRVGTVGFAAARQRFRRH